jgi:peptide deformylase
LNIVRPARIKAKWKDADGKPWEEELYGYQARCFMHEMDHLDGVSMSEHVSPKIWREAVANAEAKKT